MNFNSMNIFRIVIGGLIFLAGIWTAVSSTSPTIWTGGILVGGGIVIAGLVTD